MANSNKQKVEDIFAEVDKTSTNKSTVKRSVAVPKTKANKPLSTLKPTNKKHGSQMRILVTFVIIVFLGITYVIISGFFDNNSENSTNTTNTNSTQNVPSSTNNDSIDDNNTILPVPIKENTGPLDTDGDGLFDEEEIKIGTSIVSSDTDGDGLFDREEVEVYKTDPKLKDTDGDGETDGVEVDNGYNPNGEGLLLDLQNSIDNL